MNLSVKSEYALEAIFDLAVNCTGSPVKIGQIAKRRDIPQKFLELILAALKQGGFVESRRGVDGGYMLARAPDSITVGEVLRYVEGARRAGSRGGARVEETPFTDVWRQVDDAVNGILDRTTFADVVRHWAERSQRHAPDWTI
jgi:Rrf2 family transcriptional regulator, cysteine metabolism repressor